MTTLHRPFADPALNGAFEAGIEYQTDLCSRQHLDRIADILDVIEKHAGDVEKLRSGILGALGHDAP